MSNTLEFKINFSKQDLARKLKLPRTVSPDLAYLCGVLVGDGSVYKREKKKEYTIKCVGNPEDEKEFYFMIIGPTFQKVFGFTPKISYQDSNTTFGFIVYSKALFEYLTEVVGLLHGKKDQKLRIPEIMTQNNVLLISFIRGVFDTDGCICFKKRYSEKPYYPVISLSSKSKALIKDISGVLKGIGFKVVETYDYMVNDKRIKSGFTIINRLELNGRNNLNLWNSKIKFDSPKHLEKIKKWEGN